TRTVGRSGVADEPRRLVLAEQHPRSRCKVRNEDDVWKLRLADVHVAGNDGGDELFDGQRADERTSGIRLSFELARHGGLVRTEGAADERGERIDPSPLGRRGGERQNVRQRSRGLTAVVAVVREQTALSGAVA